MALGDLWELLLETLSTRRLRAVLTMLGIVVGMAAVVLLSSIGAGTRAGVAQMFAQFGATVVGVAPGRTRTLGASPGVMGGTTRPLTIEDALALRRVSGVRYVAPHVLGTGLAQAGERERRTMIYGTVWEDQHCLQWYPRLGTFLPPGDPDQQPPVCVLGATVARELYVGRSPLGSYLRLGEARFRVIGVMEPKGQMLGVDLDDMVYVPVRRAMRMFDLQSVMEIHVLAASHEQIAPVVRGLTRALVERHDGELDFTITTSADALAVVDQIMDVLFVGVLVIAAISVLVGALGILTIMWVVVHERTGEIGLLKAIGASDRQVMLVFLSESGALALAGGVVGAGLGWCAGWLLSVLVPAIRVETPPWSVPMALGVSLAVGLVAGTAPALRAAQLDPVDALRAE